MRRFFVFALFAIFHSVSGIAKEVYEGEYEPLYAGTLLSFYPTNVDPGDISVQPYIFAGSNYGVYNSDSSFESLKNIDSLNFLLALETGVTKIFDITLIMNALGTKYGSKHSLHFGDMNLYGGFQISKNKKDSWIPDCRLLIGETFPTGKFQKLNPDKAGSDVSGFGSFATSFVSVVRKIFYTYPHPISINLNLLYVVYSKVKIDGFSVYGGGEGTKGTVAPGNQFIANLGLEFSIDKFWELGLDVRYIYANKSRFSGKEISGVVAGLPSSELLSLAPCLEYNFNENFSVAIGAWFSVFGRNSVAFASGVANVFYYF